MEKVNVFAQRCHESQPSLVTATGDFSIGVPVLLFGKGAPLLSWLPIVSPLRLP